MWKNKLKLQESETLHPEPSRTKGHMAQEEIDYYLIKNENGETTGRVQYTNHSSVKAPFTRSFTLTQYDVRGRVIIHTNW